MNEPSPSHLAQARAAWALDDSLEFVRKVENWIYAARCGSEELILRLTDPEHRDRAQLESELAWVAFLAEHGVRAAAPVPSASGDHVEELVAEGRLLFAVTFRKARGRHARTADLTPSLFRTWGRTLGSMHRATQGYVPKPGLAPRPEWSAESGLNEALEAAEHTNSLPKDHFLDDLAWLRELRCTPSTYGLVHADLHHGNFFVDEAGELEVFDFDDCHRTWFAYDAAVPFLTVLSDWEREEGDQGWGDMWPPFAAGYATTSPGALDEEHVKRFARFRAAYLHLWCTARVQRGQLTGNALTWAARFQAWIEGCLTNPSWP